MWCRSVLSGIPVNSATNFSRSGSGVRMRFSTSPDLTETLRTLSAIEGGNRANLRRRRATKRKFRQVPCSGS